MLLSMASRFICNIFSYLYPAYASYKALTSPSPYSHASSSIRHVQAPTHDGDASTDSTPLSQRRPSQPQRPYPLTENSATGRAWTQADKDAEIERWLMYWAVVGTWAGVEGVSWWLLSWIPFYSFFKCGFFLWLSLPQTQGSTILFNSVLSPFFDAHERDIDAALAELKSRTGGAVWSLGSWALSKVKEIITSNINFNDQSQGSSGIRHAPGQSSSLTGNIGDGHHGHATSPQPPTMQDPASGVMQQAYSFGLHYASRYLPVVASTIMSASMAAADAVPRPSYSGSHQDYVEPRLGMPEPIPTGGFSPGQTVPTSFAGRRTSSSNTMRHASSSTSAIRPEESARRRAAAATRSSSDSGSGQDSPPITAQSTGSSKGSRAASGNWGGASGYEEISREEVIYNDVGAADHHRPQQGARSSSWFGWNSTPDKSKSE